MNLTRKIRTTTAAALAAALSTVGAAAAAPTASAAECSTGPVGTPGSIPALGFSKRDWPLTGGLHMDSYNGSMSRNSGVVTATTHLYNSYWGQGYHGSALVKMFNRCGDLIGVTEPNTYGVEAKAWFWNANERFESWQEQVDPAIANRVASVEVVHNRSVSTTGTIANYNSLRDLACQVWPQIDSQRPCPLPRL